MTSQDVFNILNNGYIVGLLTLIAFLLLWKFEIIKPKSSKNK